ncbi:A/G-specific adenine glycosylase [Sphingomonas montana]|uniref:A/G-specific adenine glycosylase n=1 Tax=Sphingomonas montana TaxID=1843236 RepID=UPI00096EC667|nr:A/G-specific adenine glycosylase [Sphingomonas montana]
MSVDHPPDQPADGTPNVAAALLAWYDVHHRSLPWRAPPGAPAPDPYRVWLSEVMLQQTTVAAVRAAYLRFTARWPTVADLAAAADADLMAAWAGLGYYARARNLLACARAVVADHGGRFPDTEAGLRALPGLGAYTAAAVAAIAFGRRAVVVDANVERVVTRLFAIETPLPAARPAIRVAADRLTPPIRAGDFAQAMMDLGATICTARRPACAVCPLRPACAAVRTADPARFPVKAAKAVRPERQGAVWWIERDDAVLLVRRPPTGLLGGMRALPTGAWIDAAPADLPASPPADPPPVQADWTALPGTVTHVFTHFRLTLTVFRAVVIRDIAAELDGMWWPRADLDRAGLPTLFAKAAALALESPQCP